MLELACHFTALNDGGNNRHLSLTMLALSHIDFKNFSQHFAPTKVFDGTLICAATVDGPAFFFLQWTTNWPWPGIHDF